MAGTLRKAGQMLVPAAAGLVGVATAQNAEPVPVADALRSGGFIEIPARDRFDTSQHLIYAALDGEKRMERYDTWYSGSEKRVRVIARFGAKMCGHPGIVHGGAASLVFDDLFGCTFFSMGLGTGFTANLNVDFRSPLPAARDVLLEARVVRRDGRKVFLEAVMCEATPEAVAFLDERQHLQEGAAPLRVAMRHAGVTCYSEATALFIMKSVPQSEARVASVAKRQRLMVESQRRAAEAATAAEAEQKQAEAEQKQAAAEQKQADA